MTESALECAGEIDREIDWLCTRIKVAASQALTVPVDLAADVADSPAVALKVWVGASLAVGIAIAINKLWTRAVL